MNHDARNAWKTRTRAYIHTHRGEHDIAARLFAEAAELFRRAGANAEARKMLDQARFRAADAAPIEGEPDPNCYGCLGTGRIQGFGHHGKHCLCLDMIEKDY